jgi:cytochrome c-type biogenesis protein CcmH/NrfG
MLSPTPMILLAASLVFGPSVVAAPYTPASPTEVVGRLATGSSPAAEREFKSLRAQLNRAPDNLDLACRVARELVERARITSDPRHLSYAEAALRPWWTQAEPPIPALVLRATILQSLHQFDASRIDLQQAVRRDPSNVQAWLTLATIDTLQGRFAESRHACFRLLQRGQEFAAVAVAANIGSMTGRTAAGIDRLESLLRNNPEAAPDLRRWALTMLGEMNARLGRTDAAERSFQNGLLLNGSDAYLLGAWSDFLLDQHRPSEVIALLADHERQDSLVLRLAEARSQRRSAKDQAELPALIDRLDAGFAAGHLRPRFIHQREEARHLLRLKTDATAALTVALENWTIQHEPADIRLVLESAAAANQPAAAQPVLEWIRANGYEDPAIRNLAAALATTTVASSSNP